MHTRDQSDYAALVLRLALGTMFLAHGLLKLMVFTLPGTVAFFESIGLPGAVAYLVTWMEVIGGLLLIFGVAVRLASFALLPILLGAVVVHFDAGWVFSNPEGGWEYPAFLALACIAQALLGAGAFALGSRLNGGAREGLSGLSEEGALT